MPDTTSLTQVLDAIHQQIDGEQISIGDIIDTLKHRGFGPLLLAASLLTASPIGVIPGVPAVTAILVILFSSQLLIGRDTPWVPERIRRFTIEKDKFERSRKKMAPFADKVDKLLKPRFERFASKTAFRVVAVVCIVLATLLAPLEFVPFAALAPAVAILFFSLGISAKDGLLIIIGLTSSALAAGFAVYLLI